MLEFIVLSTIVGFVLVGAGYVGYLMGHSRGTKTERRWWVVQVYDKGRLQ